MVRVYGWLMVDWCLMRCSDFAVARVVGKALSGPRFRVDCRACVCASGVSWRCRLQTS